MSLFLRLYHQSTLTTYVYILVNAITVDSGLFWCFNIDWLNFNISQMTAEFFFELLFYHTIYNFNS